LPNITEEIITKSHKTTLGQASAFIPSKPRSLILDASLIIIPEKHSKKIAIIISDLLFVIKFPKRTQREDLSGFIYNYLL
jgi:hypothetical protein